MHPVTMEFGTQSLSTTCSSSQFKEASTKSRFGQYLSILNSRLLRTVPGFKFNHAAFFAVDMPAAIIGPHMAGPHGVGGQSSMTRGTRWSHTGCRATPATLPRPEPPSASTQWRETQKCYAASVEQNGVSSAEKLNTANCRNWNKVMLQ